MTLLPGLARPILVAHAGGAVSAGGHVAEGVERAIDAGAGMIELDVRRTADGVLIVHHGDVAGDAGLRDRPFSDVVSPGIPALTDILDRVAGRVAVNLDLKETGLESDVIAAVQTHLQPTRVLITSFLDQSVKTCAELAPSIPVGLIVGRRPALSRPAGLAADVFPFRRLRACHGAVLASSRPLDLTGMRTRAERHGVPLMVWTVNDRGALRAALTDSRLLGVVTDRFDHL